MDVHGASLPELRQEVQPAGQLPPAHSQSPRQVLRGLRDHEIPPQRAELEHADVELNDSLTSQASGNSQRELSLDPDIVFLLYFLPFGIFFISVFLAVRGEGAFV